MTITAKQAKEYANRATQVNIAFQELLRDQVKHSKEYVETLESVLRKIEKVAKTGHRDISFGSVYVIPNYQQIGFHKVFKLFLKKTVNDNTLNTEGICFDTYNIWCPRLILLNLQGDLEKLGFKVNYKIDGKPILEIRW